MNCLERSTIRALAAGRGQKDDLEAAGRHLAQCARCRGAVAAAASGVPGPGETIVFQRVTRKPQTVLKYGVALLSVVVAATTWRYGAANPGAAPADIVRSEASPESEPVAPVKETVAALRELPAPAPSARPRAPDGSMITGSLASSAPTISLVTDPTPGSPTPNPAPDTASETRPVAAVVRRTKRPTARLRKDSGSSSRRPTAASPPPPNVVERATQDQDFDFGIDEPEAAPAPRRSRIQSIRTTLE